jgi:hypothetical protein
MKYCRWSTFEGENFHFQRNEHLRRKLSWNAKLVKIYSLESSLLYGIHRVCIYGMFVSSISNTRMPSHWYNVVLYAYNNACLIKSHD